jgi:hypothetical protein
MDSGEMASIVELNAHLQDCIHEYTLNLYKISSFEGSEDVFLAALGAGKREIENKWNLAAKT